MTDWLLDTLLWTGVLLALVLVLRRPVSQYFGARAAYALWALPVLRLVMPGITLPAWMNPSPEPVAAVPVPAYEVTYNWTLEEVPAATPAVEAGPVFPFDVLSIVIAAWLTGAAVFLVLRFRAYFQMRRELLENAREVGTVDGGMLGPVRLVETPATGSPLAFGVRDRVIALPPRFLAMAQRPMRDLALAHELAHHRAGDLFANFAVQPLFALHWFNPLGWVGWRAMRRDQEAACDARVVGTADAELRATYAQTIASFAAGPALSREVALAAPMACPVLGDKSIIHRLRSLKMSDISHRRRWAGRSLLLAGALALPLTASITYAEATDEGLDSVPEAPPAPLAAAAPMPLAAPDAPEAPKAPASAESEDGDVVFEAIDRQDDGRLVERRIVRVGDKAKGGKDKRDRVYILKKTDKDGKVHVEERRFKGFAFTDDQGNAISEEEFERYWENRARELEEMGERIAERFEKRYGKTSMIVPVAPKPPVVPRPSAAPRPVAVRINCDDGPHHAISEDAVAIAACAEDIARDAVVQVRSSLKAARSAIATDRNLTSKQRREALEAVDQEIERIDRVGCNDKIHTLEAKVASLA